MMRSLFSGVSGLRNHQTKMDVIGNNIANVNTSGFKASRVTFQQLYSQTLKTASSPTAMTGGSNPQQVGLGVKTAAIDVLTSTGGVQTTDRILDLAIEDEGYFMVTSGDATYFTRSGNFYLDPNGNLVTSEGMYVQGIMFESNNFDSGSISTDNPVADQMFWTDITTYEDHVGSWADPDSDPGEGDRFPESGVICIPDNFYNISIDKNGLITGLDETATLVTIGVLQTAVFVNPPGLTQLGNNLLAESNNSGTPIVLTPNKDGAGALVPSALEMSNVDLSAQFTDMIITQRGFQANSRIITVSDSLLEELINLKR